MALQTLNTIKNWFKTGLKPTQTQFWDTWDSFRHKYDKVPVKEVEGLDDLLLSKADKAVLDNHLADKNAHAPQVNTDWNSESGFSQLLNKPDFKTINGEPIVGDGNITIKEGGAQTLDETLTNSNTSAKGMFLGTYNSQVELNGSRVALYDRENGQEKVLNLEGNSIGYYDINPSKSTRIEFERNANGPVVYKFDPDKTASTYTIATLDDITSSTQNLDQTLTNGNTANNIIKLTDGSDTTIISKYAVNVEDNTGNTLGLTSISLYGKGSTNNNNILLLTNREASGGANYSFDPNKASGEYTLATKDDINVPVSATQSGIIDNTPLQELGGADKYINGVRIGKGNDPDISNVVFASGYTNEVSTGIRNTALGFNTLNSNTTGNNNTTVGSSALTANTTGSSNAAVGRNALMSNTTASFNSAFGTQSLMFNTTGTLNMAFGSNALLNNTTGNNNTSAGASSLQTSTTGGYNTSFGTYSLYNSNGVSNIAIGNMAGSRITTGNNNIVIGATSNSNLPNNSLTTGSNNLIISPNGGLSNGIATGNGNVVLGKVTGLDANSENTMCLSDGVGNLALKKESDNRLLAPSLTNALITSGGAKSLVTKEYLDEKTQIKDKQIIISSNEITVNDSWNGQTIIFENSCNVIISELHTPEFSFNAITLEDVTINWQASQTFGWVFGYPEPTPEKTYVNLTMIGNTYRLILSK